MTRPHLLPVTLALTLALAAAGCGGTPPQTAEPQQTPAEPSASAVEVTETGTRVTLAVTDDGFVPGAVQVPAGKPVTLVVTRTTEKTCATELVMKEHDINTALPLNQPVEITFTPAAPGELRYACAMDMIAGIIVVQ